MATRRDALLLALLAAAGRFAAPVSSAGAAAPEGPRRGLSEVASGVFVHVGAVAEMTPANRGDIANIGVVVGREAVAVIDSGGSPSVGEAALAAIRSVTPLPVSHLVLTHMHPDHVFGAQAFAEAGAAVHGHRRLAAALAARAEHYRVSMATQIGESEIARLRIVTPDSAVAEETVLDLGGRTLRLRAWDTAHTDNDLTVLDEATGTLFSGDLVFMDHLPTLDGSILGWLAQTPLLKALPARRVVPGHGPASAPWPQAIEPQTRYLQALADAMRTAIREGVPLGQATEGPLASLQGEWGLFDVYNARNATAAYAELEWE